MVALYYAVSCWSSETELPLITVILTGIKWSPLLRGCGHPLLSPNELFLLSWPVLNGHIVKGNHSNMVINSMPGNEICQEFLMTCNTTVTSWHKCFISPFLYQFVLLCHTILSLNFLNRVSDFVSALVHELYRKLSNASENVAFIICVWCLFYETCIEQSNCII